MHWWRKTGVKGVFILLLIENEQEVKLWDKKIYAPRSIRLEIIPVLPCEVVSIMP